MSIRILLATTLIAAVTPVAAVDHKHSTVRKLKEEFNPVFVDIIMPHNIRAAEHGAALKRVDCHGIEEWFHTPRTDYDSYEIDSEGNICGLAENLPIPVAKATPLRIQDNVLRRNAR